MEMTTIQKLKKAGFKFTKTIWPMVTREDLIKAGISHEEFCREFRGATIHETMGPNWKYGIKFQAGSRKDSIRVLCFKNQ